MLLWQLSEEERRDIEGYRGRHTEVHFRASRESPCEQVLSLRDHSQAVIECWGGRMRDVRLDRLPPELSQLNPDRCVCVVQTVL